MTYQEMALQMTQEPYLIAYKPGLLGIVIYDFTKKSLVYINRDHQEEYYDFSNTAHEGESGWQIACRLGA